MVKRKLAISKSPTKGKPSGTSEISGVKVKKILEHINTESFMKFHHDNVSASVLPSAYSTDLKRVVQSNRVPQGKGISKKDKMRFKKQRLLQKFESISADFKKGVCGKTKIKLKKANQTVSDNANTDTAFNTQHTVDEITINEYEENDKTDQALKKRKDSKSETTISIKNLLTSKPEISGPVKSVRKTTIFRKTKNNSNKNRQKNFSRGLKAYQKEAKNEKFIENPIKAITDRVTAYVRRETAV